MLKNKNKDLIQSIKLYFNYVLTKSFLMMHNRKLRLPDVYYQVTPSNFPALTLLYMSPSFLSLKQFIGYFHLHVLPLPRSACTWGVVFSLLQLEVGCVGTEIPICELRLCMRIHPSWYPISGTFSALCVQSPRNRGP